MSDFLLASMPFCHVDLPSIQIGALASYVRSRGCPVDARHWHVRAADYLGVSFYRGISEYYRVLKMLYSALLFPEHFQQNEEEFRRDWNALQGRSDLYGWMDWDDTQSRLAAFHDSIVAEFQSGGYRGIGLTATYHQLLPSLWLARRLKENDPGLLVVLGGVQVTGEMGETLLPVFPQIDAVVHGEGEETLLGIVRSLRGDGSPRPRGLFRAPAARNAGSSPGLLDVNSLSVPDYEEYFAEVERCTPKARDAIGVEVRLPLEASRGCLWGNCSFCAFNSQFPDYRTRSVAKTAADIDALARRHRVLNFHFVDNLFPVARLRRLLPLLAAHGRHYAFFIRVRAALHFDDYLQGRPEDWGIHECLRIYHKCEDKLAAIVVV